MNSTTSCAPFQLAGCGPTFGFLNGLRVDEGKETCKVCHEMSLCDSFYFPLFYCPIYNSPTEVRSTCDNIVGAAPSRPRLLVPTPTSNGPDFNDDTAPPQLVTTTPRHQPTFASTAVDAPLRPPPSPPLSLPSHLQLLSPSTTFSFTVVDAEFHPMHPHLAQCRPYGPRRATAVPLPL